MRATTILAIVAIVAALGAVTSFAPIHQANAAPGGTVCGSQHCPMFANGQGEPVENPNSNAMNQGTAHAGLQTPENEPCSTFCIRP